MIMQSVISRFCRFDTSIIGVKTWLYTLLSVEYGVDDYVHVWAFIPNNTQLDIQIMCDLYSYLSGSFI